MTNSPDSTGQKPAELPAALPSRVTKGTGYTLARYKVLAWEYIAEHIDECLPFPNSGLCNAIYGLYLDSRIPGRAMSDMLNAIRKFGPPETHGPMNEHRWPLGDRASRAAFARDMAAKCRAREAAEAIVRNPQILADIEQSLQQTPEEWP